MQLDSLNRGLLGFVLLLTLLLLVQRWVFPFDGLRSGVEASSALRPFDIRILQLRTGPLLMRFDSESGSVWRRELEADGPWDRLNEDVVLTDPSADEAAGGGSRRLSLTETPEVAQRKQLEETAKAQGIDIESLPEDLGALTYLARTANPKALRGWAINRISGYPARDAVPALLPLLDQGDTAVLIKAVGALRLQRDPVAIEPLRKLLTHPKAGVRKAAASAIESLEADAAALAD